MRIPRKGDLGPGEAVDRILALRADLPRQLANAKAYALAKHDALEKRILERVPPDLRRRAESLLKAAEAAEGENAAAVQSAVAE